MQHHQVVQSITYILGGTLLQMFSGIGAGWASTFAAIIGFVIFLTGLSKLQTGLDATGQSAVGLLRIAAYIGIVASVVDLIPLMGILGGIGYTIAFGVQLVGLLRLRGSSYIGEPGRRGANFLVLAMALAIATALFEMIPFVGEAVASFLALVALVMIFIGWIRIQEGLLSNTGKVPAQY